MLRYILTPLAALVLLTASMIPDDAYARGRGGGGYRGGGGFHGGGHRGGAVAVRGGGHRGGAVAVRGGRYGYAGYGYRRGVGAAAVGAAAVGAAAAGTYYRGGCGYDAYGNWICPGYQY
ncbi:hypothetical protein FFI89_025140 [Bradyrhizobium sp. KBS0727]|uniref:hypothetical protein n=1 Tax=unclassified Bradyrhizobium TaxID=2631580 RepID=UPI00110D37EA|nr:MULTISPECIES: hypothetical protein [unclassified Bradyrhizobium]QDW40130.1 hypothetical protein FFI71_025145 [Bradyrhizobium sp. KBS0725]QDW46733.1 hypothetical protein FFI89_025140 [Bradyrhizobium sp. KBS0727]